MNKKIIYILILSNFLICNQTISTTGDNLRKIDKKRYSELFKQARSLERNGLFSEAEIIYKNILDNDPVNKVAFNKIKIILKNKNDLELLKKLTESYNENQPGNVTAKIDLLEVYLWSDDERWIQISDAIINKNINNDFIIKMLLNKILASDFEDYGKQLIELKRQQKGKEDFYSFEMGNYYISRIDYENSIRQFLIFLEKNPEKYNKIVEKIITIPDYIEVQNNIKKILTNSSLISSKILLSDMAFKSRNFETSYDLLKNNFQNPNQLLDFAYQNKKIKNYDLAITVYNDIINENYNSKTTITAILDMADALEQKSMLSRIDLPISRYFHDNKILNSPYYYVNSENLGILNKAISLYDSLYTISKGSEPGFKLAEIKFSVLNDMDGASKIYTECIKYSKNNNIKFNSKLRVIDLMIAKGELNQSKKIINKYIKESKTSKESNLLRIKSLQVDFFTEHSAVMDSISSILISIDENNTIYNDLLDMQSLLLSFRNNEELLKKFSKIQLLKFQNKRAQAINELIDMEIPENNKSIINDIIISELSYLLILQGETEDALTYLNSISHETIFSEFSYILKAEIFDFILDDKKKAANIYLDFLAKYPLSIFYDDIRLRLRVLAN